MGENDRLKSPSIPIEKLRQDILIIIRDDLETSFRSQQCIYEVPSALRDRKVDAYTPRVISIGPIHHYSEKLVAMEIQKRRHLKEFCRRRVEREQDELLETLLRTISGQEDLIRRCYAADSSKLSGDQFVMMVLLDAVFILELFLRNEEYLGDNSKYQHDFIIGQPWLRAAIRRDLILLENQLPFSTLNDLYDCAMSKTDCKSFVDLSCRYFDKYKKNSEPGKKILHFTDLVRCFLSFKHPDLKIDRAEPVKTLYSATMLQHAGIKFKPLPNVSLLDIRAWKPLSIDQTPLSDKEGKLLMPSLEIDNNTECLLRNLIALEQLHYPGEEYICRYLKLLDFLVDLENDVDLLIENKVIVSKLGDSKAVAELINGLCREMVEVSSTFDPLSKLLNDYYDSSWNKNKAYLVSVYFKNIWTGTGTVVGSLILLVTVTRFILYLLRY
ncbi:hypothetical protein Peur_034410 [Populus x canadensis]|uniref:UPF0481 protein At3g47200-like n=1 Tax=Populus nigra TaxID=3691 RepID=UPI002B271C58|nr:UPF0481 protein At3g47200-like [Populus nigra]